MQAVKGYLSNGWFTPIDKTILPRQARVRLVIEEIIEKPQSVEALSPDELEKQARIYWLNKVEDSLALARDEDLSGFPGQGLMKTHEDYAWLD